MCCVCFACQIAARFRRNPICPFRLHPPTYTHTCIHTHIIGIALEIASVACQGFEYMAAGPLKRSASTPSRLEALPRRDYFCSETIPFGPFQNIMDSTRCTRCTISTTIIHTCMQLPRPAYKRASSSGPTFLAKVVWLTFDV